MQRTVYLAGLLFLTLIIGAGCASTSSKTTDVMQCSSLLQQCLDENANLISELAEAEREIDAIAKDASQLIRQAEDDLARAKDELEKQLKDEISSGDMSLSMDERGLILTVQNKILFDSGKAELKEGSRMALEKVADVLKEKTGMHRIHVDGHTDTDPIVRSGWRSNWELSAARALEVVHYLVEEKNLNPERVAASAYSEFQPVVGNQSTEGKAKNRRVEIIISPRKLTN